MSLDPRYAAIIHEWAEGLAVVVGRSAAAIQERGLFAQDFPHQELEMQFFAGSVVRVRFAFYVQSESKRATAVFTEHCGYFVLPDTGLNIRVQSGQCEG